MAKAPPLRLRYGVERKKPSVGLKAEIMPATFEIILPVFLIVAFGYGVVRKGMFSDVAVDGLVKFSQTFAIPFLLFLAISKLDVGAIKNAPLLVSYYTGAFACFFLGYLGSRVIFSRSKVDAIAIGFCCVFSNTILLGLPITERAYGADALSGNFAIIAFHAPLLYLVGVTTMELAQGAKTSGLEKLSRVLTAMFHNPLVIAIALGLLVNIASLPLPEPVSKSIDLIAGAALPTALFALGGVLARYKFEGDTTTILMICIISLFVHPVIVFTTGSFFGLDTAAMRSAVLTSAMAPGVNTYLFASIYGAALRVSAASVLMATVASVMSILFWLLILP
jgi:predicted permease